MARTIKQPVEVTVERGNGSKDLRLFRYQLLEKLGISQSQLKYDIQLLEIECPGFDYLPRQRLFTSYQVKCLEFIREKRAAGVEGQQLIRLIQQGVPDDNDEKRS